ncbi:glutathione synthase [Chitinibacter bivalviorum]|uniref:Glutathione synthetase n=1 Tax=Chitinibacter bivalviorum TaxID=2739434 RepID=A0A7H9BL51_9NEIS|nr:glutathione synthase [Chitinibacter bivalviorum]QLG89122.1 glutathione synthase [Chitinibacter bivalviorum]
MRILFVADPLSGFKIYKDSTYAMMREAHARGHQVLACIADDLRLKEGVVEAKAQWIGFTETQVGHDWYHIEQESYIALRDVDAVVMRKDPPFDQQYLYATQLFSLAETQGAKVFNRGQALRDFNEKLAIFQFAEYIAPTMVSQNMADIRAFVSEHGDVIVKPLDGMGGAGIFRITNADANLGSILEMLSHNGERLVMAQKYLPAIKDGDKRILLIDGVPVDWCLARIPQNGETRGNLAAGGAGVARPLTAKDREIAEKLGPQLAAQGLLLVGLDVIGENLTEVNVTSPTCFQEIAAQSGINVAGLFIDALERKCC